MLFRSRKDGSHYPIQGRSLFHNKTREKLYQKNIHYGDKYQAEESVQFANQKWSEYSERSQKVHLVQAMNEARNKARVITTARDKNGNYKYDERTRREAAESDKILTKWIDDHKGNYGENHPKSVSGHDPHTEKKRFREYLRRNYHTRDDLIERRKNNTETITEIREDLHSSNASKVDEETGKREIQRYEMQNDVIDQELKSGSYVHLPNE